MIILFQNILFLKEFVACNGFFGLFTKIKKGLGIAPGTHYQWTKFQCHTFFPSWDIKQNVSSSYLDSWWRHKLLDLSSINLKSNGWQGEKEGKMEIQKFKYLENGKSFLDEIKSIFHSFWRAIIWWEITILYKIADTSFK